MYEREGKGQYHCHNCNVTMSFDKFLETLDYGLYKEYRLRKLKDSNYISFQKKTIDVKGNSENKLYFLNGMKRISQLPFNHEAKKYIEQRKIPTPFHRELIYCPKFYEWVNKLIPYKFDKSILVYDTPRVVIPFVNDQNILHAVQGRAIDKNDQKRYILCIVDETIPHVYGLNRCDFKKRVYVFEGPFDSMFIENSIATSGGDLVSAVHGLNKENMVVVYDCEPYSKETVQKMHKALMNGYSVWIPPNSFEYKDVNEAVINGLTADYIQYTIDKNVYSGLAGIAALNNWKKVS